MRHLPKWVLGGDSSVVWGTIHIGKNRKPFLNKGDVVRYKDSFDDKYHYGVVDHIRIDISGSVRVFCNFLARTLPCTELSTVLTYMPLQRLKVAQRIQRFILFSN